MLEIRGELTRCKVLVDSDTIGLFILLFLFSWVALYCSLSSFSISTESVHFSMTCTLERSSSVRTCTGNWMKKVEPLLTADLNQI